MRIDAENLVCRRSGRLVFAGISFSLAAGEALAVTGRNGAGKSSLLAIIAGRLKPEAGALRAAGLGDQILAEALHEVGHRDALKSALTAEENLAFDQDLLGLPALHPREALEVVGLAHATRLPVAYLSAGQRRRVALARLLVARRPLWLLDEPTSALDAAAQEMLLGLMRRHLGEGGLIVAATHAALAIDDMKELRLGGIHSHLRGGAGVGVANQEPDRAVDGATELGAFRNEGTASLGPSPSGTTPTPAPAPKGEGKGTA